MDENLKLVMEKYIGEVERVCRVLLAGINEAENLDLRDKWDLFAYRSDSRKMDFSFWGICYRFHGIGCAASYEGVFLDWDFGYRSRWCGVDPWKLAATLEKSGCSCMAIEFYKVKDEFGCFSKLKEFARGA